MTHPSRIILHGTGAGDPSGERGASAASLVFSDGSAFLLDAGEGCSRAMLRDGLRLNDTMGVAVSHTHADHWTGLPNLVMGWALAKRTAPVDLYLPPGSGDFFRTVFQISYMLPQRLGFTLRFHDLHELSRVDLPDGWRIRPFRTAHLDKYESDARQFGIPFPAFGYVVEKEGRKILFSQDLASEDDLLSELPGCDSVICELAHIDPANFLSMARQAGVGRVVLTHIPPELPSLPGEIPGIEWQQATDGTVLPLE